MHDTVKVELPSTKDNVLPWFLHLLETKEINFFCKSYTLLERYFKIIKKKIIKKIKVLRLNFWEPIFLQALKTKRLTHQTLNIYRISMTAD